MSNITPQITAIIPTYRRPKMLERAVRSVLRQSYPHLLVCVYDDASGDDTAEVVAALSTEDSRVRYHAQPKNIGKLANFQFGMDRLETPYFTILSDDDVFLPELFADAMQAFEAHPEAGFFAGSSISVSEESKEAVYAPLHFWPREGHFSVTQQPPVPSLLMFPYWPGTILRSSVIAEIGPLDPDIPQVDLDYNLRVAARFPILISKRPGAIFVLQPTSAFQLAALDDYWPAFHKISQNIQRDEQIPWEVRDRLTHLVNTSATMFLLRESRKYLRSRNFRDAHRVAAILRDHYREPARAAILELATRLCECSALAHAAYSHSMALYDYLDMTIGERSRIKAAYPDVPNWL